MSSAKTAEPIDLLFGGLRDVDSCDTYMRHLATTIERSVLVAPMPAVTITLLKQRITTSGDERVHLSW